MGAFRALATNSPVPGTKVRHRRPFSNVLTRQRYFWQRETVRYTITYYAGSVNVISAQVSTHTIQ